MRSENGGGGADAQAKCSENSASARLDFRVYSENGLSFGGAADAAHTVPHCLETLYRDLGTPDICRFQQTSQISPVSQRTSIFLYYQFGVAVQVLLLSKKYELTVYLPVDFIINGM